MTPLIVGGAGGFIVILLAIFWPKRHCPNCQESLPRLRVPTSGRQFMRGGWTCPGCGCELDRHGRIER
jgi:hypothetical protein